MSAEIQSVEKSSFAASEQTRVDQTGDRFTEVQRLWSNMIARVMLPLSFCIMTGVILIVGIQKQGTNWPQLLLVLSLASSIELFAIFGVSQRTTVTTNELRVRVRPFWGKAIQLQQITSASAVKYNPLVDTGGWGIRRSRKYGNVYNMAGDRGVHIVYTDANSKERNMLIGSMRSDELVAAIDDAQAALM
ncbi:MAG: hypothetical protein H6815_09330 [Phycisphaeraceae bacterium]|nr:hypothetical protein [Phycisphaerales bacterium]MCB9860639.1 hypothetical protein [Phycisphaeraceae bacterium]